MDGNEKLYFGFVFLRKQKCTFIITVQNITTENRTTILTISTFDWFLQRQSIHTVF